MNPMQQSTLNDAELDALAADLLACATDLDLRGKGGPELRAEALAERLPEALEGLKSGALRALQIRYRFEGRAWCDTVQRGADGFSLWRIEMA